LWPWVSTRGEAPMRGSLSKEPREGTPAGHIFLGFSKCGRYVLSYTSNSGDDDFSFYIYHLYWWEFNVHSKLKLVRQVRLFQDEEIYSDFYLTVCEWPSDSSKVIVFGFNTRSTNGLLMNLMMSDENHRDIYISTVAMPPLVPCPDPNAHCLRHGFMLHTKYQVVYPFPTFQPAFQLKKDQVVLLNTSYSLVACAVSVHTAAVPHLCCIHNSLDSFSCHSVAVLLAPEPHVSPAVAKAKEFVADIFRRAKEAKGAAGSLHDSQPAEPGYINYTKLRYVLEPGDLSEPEDEYEDDKISLPFVVTDLRGRNLKPLKERAVFQGQYLTVEQLTLDFEYVINEVIRNDASWSKQFCSFSDYDIVILEVGNEPGCVELQPWSPASAEEGEPGPKTYHTSLKVAWDLTTGIFVTVGIGDLTEVKGQTSGSVWSSYRKSCVDTVMKWLVPESSGRYVNRMTNEALHKGCSLKVLADNERYTWIVL
uniref:DDB1 and CUL4 associated factor 15 n=1 Tax=Sphenodon punctatus TaxID=8508 RepID=A0A8D0GHN3_SPHPU